jgi:hypothetical protein
LNCDPNIPKGSTDLSAASKGEGWLATRSFDVSLDGFDMMQLLFLESTAVPLGFVQQQGARQQVYERPSVYTCD